MFAFENDGVKGMGLKRECCLLVCPFLSGGRSATCLGTCLLSPPKLVAVCRIDPPRSQRTIRAWLRPKPIRAASPRRLFLAISICPTSLKAIKPPPSNYRTPHRCFLGARRIVVAPGYACTHPAYYAFIVSSPPSQLLEVLYRRHVRWFRRVPWGPFSTTTTTRARGPRLNLLPKRILHVLAVGNGWL